MRTLKGNISYKLYLDGKEFIEDNQKYLNKSIQTSVETAFFFLNAKSFHQFNQKNFALQFKNKTDILLIIKLEAYNMLIFGSKKLCDFAANTIANLNLSFESILGEEACVLEFLKRYQKRLGGQIHLQHSMQIMVLKQLLYTSKGSVFQCKAKDLKDLAECYCAFQKEALQKDMELPQALEVLEGKEQNFYAIKDNEQIVSIATKTRNYEKICSISHVFTKPEFRGHGFAKQVVSKLSQDILAEGKLPYLFVDSTNPISNHLYLSLGFEYLIDQAQYQYGSSFIKKAIFAGGCFWCMAEPFYALDGVKKVLSGYIGGKEVLPSYSEVKQGTTGHREAILIEYDSSKIKYNTLLDLYFTSIDSFDSCGQYIDRGNNYTCGIYTSNDMEKDEILKKIKVLEQVYNQKVCVDICDDAVFYPAEEEHQDYALKHPKELQEELEKSGRLKKGKN